jgi:hypothetical protein
MKPQSWMCASHVSQRNGAASEIHARCVMVSTECQSTAQPIRVLAADFFNSKPIVFFSTKERLYNFRR